MSHAYYKKYLQAPRPRIPLGKLEGLDAYRQVGADTMHTIKPHPENSGKWVLACSGKPAYYEYTGYSSAVKCAACRRVLGKDDE